MIDATAAAFQENCQNHFARYVDEGQKYHPDMPPSHLCIRTQSALHFGQLSAYGNALGVVGTHYKGDKQITWVHLNTPLQYGKHRLSFLEITSPDASQNYRTGPQMIVFAKDNFPVTQKENASDGSAFLFRYQAKTAEQILSF